MKIIKIEIEEHVRKFDFLSRSGYLCCIKNLEYRERSLVVKNNTDSSIELSVPGLYDLAPMSNDKLILSCIHPDSTFELSNGILKRKEYVLFLPGFSFGNYFYCYSDYNSLNGFCEIDKSSLNVTRFWQLPFGVNGISKIIGEKFLSANSQYLACYFLETGTEIWRLNLNELFNSENIKLYADQIVAYEGKIFFYVTSEQASLAFCIDEISGDEIKRFETIGGYLNQFGNKIYAIKGFDGLSELNMDTLEVTNYDFKDVLFPLKLNVNGSRFVITEKGLLIFVDGAGRPKNRFGILDLKKKELLHLEEIEIFEEVTNCIQTLQLRNGKLYVHTSDNNLHVFQLTL